MASVADMVASGEMVNLPMDGFFQPLFYTFEGLLGDIRDRLDSPNKIFGTWGSKTGPTATECMKSLGHLQAALELRPMLYGAARMDVFTDHKAQKAAFDEHAAALLRSLQGVRDIITPTLVGDSPSVQVLFVRNVLEFLNKMEDSVACKSTTALRVANFFIYNRAKVDEYKRDLAKYLTDYNKTYGKLAKEFDSTRTNVRGAIAGAVASVLPAPGSIPLPPGYGTNVAALRTGLKNAKTTAERFALRDSVAAFKKYGRMIEETGGASGAGGGQGGGRRYRRRSHKSKAKKRATRRHRKSRRHQ
jgi:hypothetical protein